MKKYLWLVNIFAVTTGCAIFPEIKEKQSNENTHYENMIDPVTYDVQIEIDPSGSDKLKRMGITQEIRELLQNNKECTPFNPSVRNPDNFEIQSSVLSNGYKARKICLIARIMERAGNFRMAVPVGKLQDKAHMFLDIKAVENGPGSFFQKSWGFLSVFTLGIIPYRAQTEVNISIDVYRNNILSKNYHLKSKYVLWIHITLLPYMPFTKTTDYLYEKMIESLLSTMKKDGVFLEN
mgnify:CR=1 FL=1